MTPVPDLLDDAGSLVAEHGRRIPRRIRSRRCVEIRVADAARDEPDQHLSLPRLREVELLHLERRPELLEHGGLDLHRSILVRRNDRQVDSDGSRMAH